MDDLIKDRDVVLLEHVDSGMIPAGYYQGEFRKLNTFLDVKEPYDESEIKGIYMPDDTGKLSLVDFGIFKTQYKAVKNLA